MAKRNNMFSDAKVTVSDAMLSGSYQKPKNTKKGYLIKLTQEEQEGLKAIAEMRREAMSNVLRDILDNYLSQYHKEIKNWVDMRDKMSNFLK